MDDEVSVVTVMRRGLVFALRDAIALTALTAGFALLVNFVHPRRIPYVATREYDLVVPCPEPMGEAAPVDAADPTLVSGETFFVDARGVGDFAVSHVETSVNVPYDYLEATGEAELKRLSAAIARRKARRVVVYGDGAAPDTGEQLARELSARGIKHVHYVNGGAPALRASGRLGGVP